MVQQHGHLHLELHISHLALLLLSMPLILGLQCAVCKGVPVFGVLVNDKKHASGDKARESLANSHRSQNTPGATPEHDFLVCMGGQAPSKTQLKVPRSCHHTTGSKARVASERCGTFWNSCLATLTRSPSACTQAGEWGSHYPQ